MSGIPPGLVEEVRAGEHRAVARAITLVEDDADAAGALLAELYPATGSALVVGVTGASGVGKSSLIAALVTHVRATGRSVGVIAVDPSSVVTRGAVLGDRIRLGEHFLDEQVFIRSMATRGRRGGVAAATLGAVHVLDAAGKDVVLVETVGAGQTEIDVARVADVVILALMPGAGDRIQALKAGVMEIPDVIAITKADLPDASAAFADVRAVVALDPDPSRRPALVRTSGVSGEGLGELWEAVLAVGARPGAGGADRRRAAVEAEVVALASERVLRRLDELIREDSDVQEVIGAVVTRTLDPGGAATRLLELARLGETDEPADAR
jgi:LAO/AO transport system kinase